MDAEIRNAVGERIDYAFASGAADTKKAGWLVLLGHGVTGNMDRPVVADTASALNAAGFDTLRFSYTGNGDSEGDFRESTISKEVGDLRAVIDVVLKAYSQVGYVGHSMGGAVGVLSAAQDDRIAALVSLAGMVETKTFAETEFGEETPDEGLMWEEETCPLSSAYMKDLCEDIVSVIPSAEKVEVPWLLIHGSADDVVLPQDTESIQALKGDAVNVVMVDGADHSFNEPAHKEQMTTTVAEWLSAQAS